VADKTTERIDMLRERHSRLSSTTEGRIELLRTEHVEVAQRDESMRQRGYKFEVIRDPGIFNFCPYLSRPTSNVYCATQASNHTSKLCYGCPTQAEWAEKQNWYTQHDPRDHRTYAPYDRGHEVPEEKRFVYERVTWPNGDVRWFHRFRWHRVSTDVSANRSHDTPLHLPSTEETQAPLASSLSPSVLEALRERADLERRKTRTVMMPKALKKPKKETAKKADE